MFLSLQVYRSSGGAMPKAERRPAKGGISKSAGGVRHKRTMSSHRIDRQLKAHFQPYFSQQELPEDHDF